MFESKITIYDSSISYRHTKREIQNETTCSQERMPNLGMDLNVLKMNHYYQKCTTHTSSNRVYVV